MTDDRRSVIHEVLAKGSALVQLVLECHPIDMTAYLFSFRWTARTLWPTSSSTTLTFSCRPTCISMYGSPTQPSPNSCKRLGVFPIPLGLGLWTLEAALSFVRVPECLGHLHVTSHACPSYCLRTSSVYSSRHHCGCRWDTVYTRGESDGPACPRRPPLRSLNSVLACA